MLRRRRKSIEDTRAEEERKQWGQRFIRCWACGAANTQLDTHEIVRRSETSDWRHEANYSRLCRECHEECHGGWLTKGILMTLKLIHDPGAYDADWIREHALRKHWEPEPLPQLCRWFIKSV